jgi:cystine transport system substrate-binding protein
LGLAAIGLLAAVSGATAAGPGTSLKSLESQRRAAVLDLYALDSHVDAAQSRLSALQEQAIALRSQEQLLELQIGATSTTLHTSQHELATNLRDLYKRGDINTLAVVLGAQSLDDAVSQLDTLNAVARQSKQVVSVTSRAERRLATLRRTLGDRRARVDAAVRAAQQTLDDLQSTRAQRVSFIDALRTKEQLKATQIQAMQARAAAAQVKAAQLTASREASPEPAPSPASAPSPAPAPRPAPAPAPAGGRSVTVSSTGYSLPGHTATGIPVGWGVVAVDPSVIPLGTKMTIPGYGEAVAADTGSAVRGYDIDLWFPSLAQARAWGRRTVTITLH